MLALLEITAAILLWAATLAFAQLGIEVDLPRPPTIASPAADRPAPSPEPDRKTPAKVACPDAKTVAIRAV